MGKPHEIRGGDASMKGHTGRMRGHRASGLSLQLVCKSKIISKSIMFIFKNTVIFRVFAAVAGCVGFEPTAKCGPRAPGHVVGAPGLPMGLGRQRFGAGGLAACARCDPLS